MDAVFPFVRVAVSLLSLHVSALQFCHSLELTAAKESVRISVKLMFLFHFFLFKLRHALSFLVSSSQKFITH